MFTNKSDLLLRTENICESVGIFKLEEFTSVWNLLLMAFSLGILGNTPTVKIPPANFVCTLE
jgi:hypothetical protein